MKFNSFFSALSLALAATGFTPFAQAQPSSTTPAAAQAGDVAMTEGEVRKVDKENKKITLKHGDIKNLDMPGMTMVFQVSDPAMLDMVKQGDKVQFKADRANGALVVTEIRQTP